MFSPPALWLFALAFAAACLAHTEQSVLIITGGIDGHTGGTMVVLGTKGLGGVVSGGGDMLSMFSLMPKEVFLEIRSGTLVAVVKNSKTELFSAEEEEENAVDEGYWLLIISVMGKMEPLLAAAFAEEEEEEVGTVFDASLLVSYTKGVFGNHVR